MTVVGTLTRSNRLELPATPLTSTALLEWLGGRELDAGVAVSPRSSPQMSAVYRAVSVTAGVSSALPLHSYRKGTKERIDDEPILDDPHPEMTDLEVWKLSYVHRLLWGDSFAQKLRNGAGEVKELWPISPHRVLDVRRKPTEANPGGKQFDIVDDNGVLHVGLTTRDIFHIPGPTSFDGIRGVSVISYAAQSIGLTLAAEKSAARFFGRGAQMGGVLETEQQLGEEKAKELKERWQVKVAGPENSHEIAVLDSGAKFRTLTMPYKDAQLLESRRFGIAEAARFFGVPLFLMFETERTTCLPADTRVFTTTGPRRIADVRVGDTVWSLDGSSKTFRAARVWRSERTGCDPILSIKTRARVLRANAQHRVLVRRKFAAPRCGPGGYRAVEWRNEWVSAGELRAGDYLVALNGLPDGQSAEAPNGRVLTPGFMAFAGLMLGDGTVSQGAVSVARHAEAPYMDFYRAVMREEFHRAAQGGTLPAPMRALRPISVRESERQTAFSSRAAADELRELGLSGTAKTKRVPEWVYGLRPDLIGEFLGGYIDSDGAVNPRGWVTFSSCNPDLLDDVKHLCMAIGVPVGTVRRYSAAGTCVVAGRTVTRGDMYQLFAYDVRANRKMTPHHPEKLRRIWDAPASTKTNVWSSDYNGRGPKGSRPGETFNIDGGALQRIQSIDVEPAEDVYDLGVEGTHSFIADGLVVHNSWGTGLEQQALGWINFDLHPTWLAPTERRITKELLARRRYAKYALQGLMRGDSAARGTWYRIMREVGALNADEIRDLEDRPPIPGGLGQAYMQPSNMQPLGSDPEAPPPAPDDDEDDEGVDD